MGKFVKYKQKEANDYNKVLESGQGDGFQNYFPQQGAQSMYSSWGYAHAEESLLRSNVNAIGIAVRRNNSDSPHYLNDYLATIYGFLIPLMRMLPQELKMKVKEFDISCRKDINFYFKQRITIPNKKISTELIDKLDLLYEVSLMSEQSAGLGYSIDKKQSQDEFMSSIEKAITGNG